jgi:DNA polymerase phi
MNSSLPCFVNANWLHLSNEVSFFDSSHDNSKLLIPSPESERDEINFKLRILELLDIFIRQQPENKLILKLFVPFGRLLLDLAKDAKSRDVFGKSVNIVRNRLTRLRTWPALPPSDVRIVEKIGLQVVSLAKKSPSNQVCGMIGEILTALVKIAVLSGETPEKIVSQIYEPLVDDFMTKKASKIHGCIFEQMIKRYPHYGWALITMLLSRASTREVVNAFRQIQAYDLLIILLRGISKKSDTKKLCSDHFPLILSAILQTLNIVITEDDSIKGLCLNRLKHMFRAIHLLIMKLSIFYSAQEIRTTWDLETLITSMQRIANDGKFKSRVLATVTNQIVGLLEPPESCKRKEKPNGPIDDHHVKLKKKARTPRLSSPAPPLVAA